jgi:hypothetical protein
MRHSRILRSMFPVPAFEGEGLAGGGGAGGDGAGGEGNGWQAPAGLPDAYRGANAEESLGKLLGGYTELNTRADGLRDKVSKLPKPPEKADDYTFEPGDALKSYFPDPANDPFLPVARAAFHKHGIANEAFQGVIGDMYSQLIEKGVIDGPFNPRGEIDTYVKAFGIDEAGADAQFKEAETFANGLMGQLKGIPDSLKEAAQVELSALTSSAGGNAVLRALASRLAESGIRISGDGGQQGQLSESEIRKLDGDPRIDPKNREHSDMNKRFDPDLRKRYDDWYAKQPPRQVAF